MSAAVDVGSAEEFAHGSIALRRVGGREIAIIRWRGRLYALRNVCPHQSGELCAIVTHRVTSSGAGHVGAEPLRPLVQCARHRWEFDLASGAALCDPHLRVKTYPVRVENGRVLVDV